MSYVIIDCSTYQWNMSPPPNNPQVKGIRCIVLVPDWRTQLLNVTVESIKGTTLWEFTPVQVLSRTARANCLLVKYF